MTEASRAVMSGRDEDESVGSRIWETVTEGELRNPDRVVRTRGRDDSADECDRCWGRGEVQVSEHDGRPCPKCSADALLAAAVADRSALAEARAENKRQEAWFIEQLNHERAASAKELAEAHRKLDETRAEATSRLKAIARELRNLDQYIPAKAQLRADVAEIVAIAEAPLASSRSAALEADAHQREHEAYGTWPCAFSNAAECSILRRPDPHFAAPVADDEPATCDHGSTVPHDRIEDRYGVWTGNCPGPVSSAEPGGTTNG